MASRPRRSAAAKANEVISEHAKWADQDERDERAMSSRRSGRNSGVSRVPASPDESHLNLNIKVAPGKLRQATRGPGGRNSESFEGGEILEGKRNRGVKKSYVVDSSPDDDEEEDEIELDDDDEEDAEGDDAMDMDAEGDDVDAEGDEDAEGDMNMSAAPSPARPTIRVTSKAKPAPRGSALKVVQDEDDEDDDDLSDPGESDEDGDQTMGLGDETMADEDAEGEEIEVVGEDDEEEEEDEDAEGEEDDGEGGAGLDSDEDASREDTPDVTKMTKRQRARFEDGPGEFMKLSDEVQAKKVFTAEELSMRRQEMARRRRNLSEKRNEEVKMETINKLLKKQAPKINKKAAAAAAAAELGEDEGSRPNPAFVRWVNNKSGSRIAVPTDMLEGPAGRTFGGPAKMGSGKMVEEVA